MMLVLGKCGRGDGAESAGEHKATVKSHAELRSFSWVPHASLFKLR
jgi:hypothetical protein